MVATSAGLVMCGGVGVAAWHGGFFGTVIVAVLLWVWLTGLVWWQAEDAHYRVHPVPSPGDDDQDDRIVLRALLDQAPTPMLAIEQGRVRALNRAARRLFATDDAVLPPPPSLLSPDRPRVRHAGRDWRIDRVETYGLGAPRTVLALVDTASEERAAEARAVRELLQMLGHEVMNGLAPIASLAESALAAYAVPARHGTLLPEILGTLGRRAEALQRFTTAYRALAQLPEPVIEPADIDGIFADIAQLFAAEWGTNLQFETICEPALIAALDRDQITQALWALVRNGAEAATASTSDGPAWVQMACRQQGETLTFTVRDSGPGVPPDARPSIFRAFFTTKADGTGIGLYIAQQIARAHGGTLAYSPAPPHRFVLRLGLGLAEVIDPA